MLKSLAERIEIMERENIYKITTSPKKRVYTVNLGEGLKYKFKTYIEALMYAYSWSIYGEKKTLVVDQGNVYFNDEILGISYYIGIFEDENQWFINTHDSLFEFDCEWYKENINNFQDSESYDIWKREIEDVLNIKIDWSIDFQELPIETELEWVNVEEEHWEEKNGYMYFKYYEFLEEAN